MVKNPSASSLDIRNGGSTPRSGRPSGGGHGNPLQPSCLENPMDRGAWWASVHSVTESRAWLSDPAHTSIRAVRLRDLRAGTPQRPARSKSTQAWRRRAHLPRGLPQYLPTARLLRVSKSQDTTVFQFHADSSYSSLHVHLINWVF